MIIFILAAIIIAILIFKQPNNKKLFREFGISDKQDIQYKVLHNKNKRTCDTMERVHVKQEDIGKIKILLCVCWKQTEEYYSEILRKEGFENIIVAPYGENLIDYFLKEKPDVTILKSNIIPYENSKNTYGFKMLSFLNRIDSTAKIIMIGLGGLLSGGEEEEAYNLGAACFIKEEAFASQVSRKDLPGAIRKLFVFEHKVQEDKLDKNNVKEDGIKNNAADSAEKIDSDINVLISKLYQFAFETKNLSPSGFAKDFTKFILNGGFWDSGDVIRHFLGENNVYETFAYKIFQNYRVGVYDKIEISKEACSYAIKNNNPLEALRFLLYAFWLKDNLQGTILSGKAIIQYCEKEKAGIPKWFVPYAYKVGVLIFIYSHMTNKNDYQGMIYDCAGVIKKYAYNNKSVYSWIMLMGLAYANTDKEQDFYKNITTLYNQKDIDNNMLDDIRNIWNEYGLYLGYDKH